MEADGSFAQESERQFRLKMSSFLLQGKKKKKDSWLPIIKNNTGINRQSHGTIFLLLCLRANDTPDRGFVCLT